VGRHATACVLIVAAWTAVSAQVVPVGKEPHHRIVYEDAHLRVLDVNIAPGDATLEHSHDHDIATVSIGPADARIRPAGADWGAARRRPLGDTNTAEYVGKQGIHTIENVSGEPYRLIAVENVKQAGWHAVAAAPAPGVKLLTEGRAFRASSLRVQPGEVLRRTPSVPSVLVSVSGDAEITSGGREPRRIGSASRWAVLAASEYHVAPRGAGEAHLVEIEVF
jgi:hypothetical protein